MKELRKILAIAWVCALVFTSGCVLTPIGGRGFRWGHTPAGHPDPFPGSLAAFSNKAMDGNGIVYTIKAGTIDPDHRAGVAENALAAYKVAYNAIMGYSVGFTSNNMYVAIHAYPANWKSLTVTEKQKLAQEVAMELAKSVSFHCEIYHELTTWWGGGVDYESSFSWEDLYSNALGAEVAMKAKKMELDGKGSAVGNVTTLTQQFVNENQYVSCSRAWEVIESLRNTYWTHSFGDIQKKHWVRNVDVGADGWIDNTPIPGFTSASMTRIKAPVMDFSNFRGFKIDVLVGSSAPYAERAANLLGVKQINIKDHPRLMQIIKKELEAKSQRVFD